MALSIQRLTLPQFSSFYTKNPDFDILTFNFLDKDAVNALKFSGGNKDAKLQELMQYQRLLRLYPDVSVAEKLIADHLDSSLKITHLSQSVFIKTYEGSFGPNGQAIARQIYAAALQAKSQVMHMVATSKNIAASPSFNALSFNNVSADVAKTFQDLDSYQDFFGSLDYCECPECKSIFGPAAYLVDLLRIIDQGITQPNPDIQEGLHFFDRRPDIEKIELTCENTNTLIPYLQIVNNLLASTLENALSKDGSLMGGNVFLTLANTYFPFNLPFHLPLQQIEAVMDNKQTALVDIATALSKDTTMSIDEARKALKLSLETLANLKKQTVASLPAVESKNYGLKVTKTNLNGLDTVKVFLKQSSLSLTELDQLLTQNLSAKEIFDVSGTYTITSFGPKMILKQEGNAVTGTYGTDGTIIATIEGHVMRGHWNSATQAPPATKGDVEFTFAADGQSFTGKWSKGLGMPWETSSWNGTLTGTSTQGIIPHSLFINAPLADRTFLHIATVSKVETIVGQSLKTLDRLNRFIRLSGLLGWSYADLNWLLMTLGASTISDTTFIDLAKIKQASSKYGVDLALLSCLWFDLKTIGMGDGPHLHRTFRPDL